MNYENKDANMNLFNFAGVEKICVENNSSVHCTTETEWIFTKPSSPIPMNLESKSLFVDESFHLNVPSKFSSDLELPSCLKKTTELKSLRNVHRHIKFSTVEEVCIRTLCLRFIMCLRENSVMHQVTGIDMDILVSHTM